MNFLKKIIENIKISKTELKRYEKMDCDGDKDKKQSFKFLNDWYLLQR